MKEFIVSFRSSTTASRFTSVSAKHGINFRELGRAIQPRSYGHIRFTVSLDELAAPLK